MSKLRIPSCCSDKVWFNVRDDVRDSCFVQVWHGYTIITTFSQYEILRQDPSLLSLRVVQVLRDWTNYYGYDDCAEHWGSIEDVLRSSYAAI